MQVGLLRGGGGAWRLTTMPSANATAMSYVQSGDERWCPPAVTVENVDDCGWNSSVVFERLMVMMSRMRSPALAVVGVALCVAACGGVPSTGESSVSDPVSAPSSAAAIPAPPSDRYAGTADERCAGTTDEVPPIESAFLGEVLAVADSTTEWVTFEVEEWYTTDLGVVVGMWAPGLDVAVGDRWLIAGSRYLVEGRPSGDVFACDSQSASNTAVEEWRQRYGGAVTAGADEPENEADPLLLSRITEARERWAAEQPDVYTVVIRVVRSNLAIGSDSVCGQGPVRSVVEDGVVVAARDLGNDCDVPVGEVDTIDDLFALAERYAGAIGPGQIAFDTEDGHLGYFTAEDRSVSVSVSVPEFYPFAVASIDDQRAALEQARQRWSEAGIGDYDLTVDIGCFCSYYQDSGYQVQVRDGKATILNPGPYTEDLDLTVEGLFSQVETALTGDSADVVYHPEYGYPVTISSDPILDSTDDELSISVTGFNAVD